jgi:hypothetical protein
MAGNVQTSHIEGMPSLRKRWYRPISVR